jgi:hypothetical protein
MRSTRTKKLIQTFGGEVMQFRNLPIPAQLAIAWYMAVDGEAWELPSEYYQASVQELKELGFRSFLPWIRRKYGSKKFGYVEIPMEVLIKQVMRDEWMKEDFHQMKDFEQYHRWYVKQGGMPNHSTTQLWPVILSSDYNEETLQDGWHRLNDYYRKGVEVVPAVYFP